MTYILCIDPGVTGAYAVLTRKKKIKLCKLFSDFQTVKEDILPYLGNLEACIEAVHGMPVGRPKSITAMIKNAGMWEGMLVALDIPYALVSPQKWPAAVFDIAAPRKPTAGIKDKKKVNAIQAQNRKIKKLHTTAYVLRALPKSKQYFKLKKDQDKADALCIGLYYIQNRLSE